MCAAGELPSIKCFATSPRKHFVQLDTIDLRILGELQQDGSLTNVELARRVHLSPSPCLVRVKGLESAGVIQRYVALVDPKAIGLGVNGWGDFEDETAVKTITVTNGAWSILMNQSSELNKSNLVARGLATANGYIRFQVTPVDINNLAGAPQTERIYIDSSAPATTRSTASSTLSAPTCFRSFGV